MTNSSFIYIIESECGRVKIGCSVRPASRLATFRAHSPRPLRMVAIWPGVRADETALHRRFAPFRRHLEWFSSEGSLAALIDAKRGEGVEPIPSWEELEYQAIQRAGRKKQSASMRAQRFPGMEHVLNVKAIRAQLGLTQTQLGEAVGVDQSTVSNWENGSTPRGPARKLLVKLAARKRPIAKPQPERAA